MSVLIYRKLDMSTLPAGYEKITRNYTVKQSYMTKSGEIKECEILRQMSYVRKNPLKQATRHLIGLLSSEQLFIVNQFIKNTLSKPENSGSDGEHSN